ncbi:MAG TPA: deoxyribonuclease V [Candidatus Polarisedimenticolia bacterium]|nr:deoxyribonuclease V [Candidatus Polarisedimenticolia bacterium]
MENRRRASRRHPWPRSPRAAIALQRRLRSLVRPAGRLKPPRHVAGADIAYDAGRGLMYAAVLVFSYPDLELRERRMVCCRIRFPYIPGLLSFREAPAILLAFDRLRIRPDLLLCDGQGIAHPRGIGLASHLGLLTGIPTIGCAKSRLVGEHGPLGPCPGDRTPLRFGGRKVGAVVRTRPGVRPLYVSPGHRIGIADAVRHVLACCRGFRLPEPVRQADILVATFKRARQASPRATRTLC